MKLWWDERRETAHEYDVPYLEVEVTDNPVVAVLFGPHGERLRVQRERPEIGFR